MKARQLREKFAGRGGSASNSGGGGSGGGGVSSANKYAGYGNSDAAWSTGTSKGYGESGIGAGSSGTMDRGYAGRYGEGGIGSSSSGGNSKPKATMVSDVSTKSTKVKKSKKKEKIAAAPGKAFCVTFR